MTPQLEAGQRVDHFHILRLLGEGGMGQVYLARDTQLGRRVALKMVHPRRVERPGAVEQFLFEARTTARFSHPNIVTIHAVGEHEGRPYLALEYLEGATLRERLDSGRVGLAESLRVGAAIGRALVEAHSHGILHRDLKPSNVFLGRDGRLRVLDFGLAKLHDLPAPSADESPDEPPAIQVSGRGLKGTPGYMAPEQWRRAPVSPATDLWALGTILFELLWGRRPFADAEGQVSALAHAVTQRTLALPSEPGLPAPLAELIRACLSRTVEERPSATHAAETLERLASPGREPLSEGVPPFPGLQPFTEAQAGVFFGRGLEINAFVERLRTTATLPIVGPSGGGKSSFVRAGVIPRLQEDASWVVLTIRPGSDPFDALARRLIRQDSWTGPGGPEATSLAETVEDALGTDELWGEVPASAPIDPATLAAELRETPTRLALWLRRVATRTRSSALLFVDQLEELFTLVEDPETSTRFLQALCAAADDPDDPVRVVFTVRDDYLGRLATIEAARSTLGQVTLISTPSADELAEILRAPLRCVGYRLDDGSLVDEMVDAVRGEPVALPILQFTMWRLWERRDVERRQLTRAAYDAMGGVAGALAEHADRILAELLPEDVVVARELLLRLVTPQRTRRVLHRGELLDGLGAEAGGILDRLIVGRLVAIRRRDRVDASGAEIELTHESLTYTWARLARWLEEDHEQRVQLDDLGRAARIWDRQGRPDTGLWHGEALTAAERLLRDRPAKIPTLVSAFVEAATALRARGRRRRRLATLAGIGALLTIALVSLGAAWVVSRSESRARDQRDLAERHRTWAEAEREQVREQRAEALQEGARAALTRGDALEARAKLRTALEGHDSTLARALWWQLGRSERVWRRDMGSYVYTGALSPDGQTVAVGLQDATIRIMDARTLETRALRGHADQVLYVAWSPDGARLASADWAGELRLWDIATGTSRLITRRSGVDGEMAYGPAGARIATPGSDSKVRIWDLSAGDGATPRELLGHTERVNGVMFHPAGRQLVSASHDQTARVWDLDTGGATVLRGHTERVVRAVFSPDGRWVATGSGDRTARIWSAESGEVRHVLRGHTDVVWHVAFTPDSRLLATTSEDRTLRFWRVDTGALERVWRSSGRLWGVGFDPTGERVLLPMGEARTVELWRRLPAPNSAAIAAHAGITMGLAFSPSGERLASAGGDERVLVWDVATGQRVLELKHSEPVQHVAYSPDGAWIAAGGRERTIHLWPADGGGAARVLHGHSGAIDGLRFTRDGRRLVSAGRERQVRLWDLRDGHDGEVQVLPGPPEGLWELALSPDDTHIATAGCAGGIRLHPLDGAEPRLLGKHDDTARGVVFSADGGAVVSGGHDGTIRRWDIETGEHTVVAKVADRVYWLDLHPDGTRIGAALSDSTARIWGGAGADPVVLRGHTAEVAFLRFGPTGRLAATTSDDGTVRLWDADTGRPLWWAPALLPSPVALLSHRGWATLDGGPAVLPETAWRRALESRARHAAWDAAARTLCFETHTGALELWDTAADRALRVEQVPALQSLAALPGACVVLAAGRARVLRAEGETDLGDGWSAVAVSGDQLALAGDEEVAIRGSHGSRVDTYPGAGGVTAVLYTPTRLVLGFADGGVEVAGGRPLSLEEVPSSRVVALAEGPADTIVAGFGNGVLGLWSALDGTRLHSEQLHGPVVHLLRRGSRVHAASQLGDHRVLDLDALVTPYCALLRRVWAEVPVVWEEGRPVLRERPADHPCARGAAQD